MTLEFSTVWFLVVAVGLIAYLFPSIVASSRGHHNASAIFCLNLLLGWTFLGWVGAMVWSLTVSDPSRVRRKSKDVTGGMGPVFIVGAVIVGGILVVYLAG